MTEATLDRARELARSGTCADVGAIRARLRSEGHADADLVVAGVEAVAELGRLCRQAQIKVRHRATPPQATDGD